MIYPDEKKFLELAGQGNLIPVSREILADTETPVSAYLKLAAQPGGAAFLLESAESAGRLGRYSFVGSRPAVVMEFRQGRVRLTKAGGEVEERAPEHPDPSGRCSLCWPEFVRLRLGRWRRRLSRGEP